MRKGTGGDARRPLQVQYRCSVQPITIGQQDRDHALVEDDTCVQPGQLHASKKVRLAGRQGWQPASFCMSVWDPRVK